MLYAFMVKATRHKHLQTILNLTRYLKKDWDIATANDIGNLVVEIVRRYTNDNWQEIYTSYDHKKILKIFFRWINLGSMEFGDVGDPPETKSIRIKTPSNRLSIEDLIKTTKTKLSSRYEKQHYHSTVENMFRNAPCPILIL